MIETKTTNTLNLFEKNNLSTFNGFAYIICRDRMIYGKVENDKITDENNNEITDWQKYLIEARFYNKDKELKVFKRMGELNVRDSTTLSHLKTKKSQQVVLGTSYSIVGNFIKATEDRGTEVYIPIDAIVATKPIDINKLNDDKSRIALQTELYIDFINNLATIVDYRIVNYKIV